MNEKSILISIKPKWCKEIGNKKKSIEVRKTRPKIEAPFKCYIYCSKTKPVIVTGLIWDRKVVNGKVIGEFHCDLIEEYHMPLNEWGIYDVSDDELSEMRLTHNELWDYGKGKVLYGWFISNVVIYDKPKEVSDFGLKRAPQSWQYVKAAKSEDGDEEA